MPAWPGKRIGVPASIPKTPMFVIVNVPPARLAGKTLPANLAGGTFTITNIGVFGIDAGTPILFPGQAGILAVGQITRRPWVVEDRVEPRWVTTLAMSFDHRMVDGAEGSAFLSDMAEILRDPGSTLIMA